MPYIQFPDVPNVPGVPPLVRSGVAEVLALSGGLAKLDALGLPTNFLNPVWGLFDQSGNSVLTYQTLESMTYHNSTRTSEFPIEQGAFTTYNKTGSPFEATMTVSTGQSEAARELLLSQVKKLQSSLDLYSLVTPEETYLNVTVEDRGYSRTTRNGAGKITVTLGLKEVRVIATAQYTSSQGSQTTPIPADQTASSSGASPESIGQVQAAEPTADESAFLTGFA